MPRLLHATFLRFMVRDQVAAMNPYGHLVVPVLAEAIGIHHNTPQLVLVPYNEEYGKYNERMAGRLAYLEEHLNSSWKKRERYGSPKDIVNAEEMKQSKQQDRKMLSSVPVSEYISAAEEIQQSITAIVIQQAFQQYPLEAYNKVGRKHEEILKARLAKLPDVANHFHDLVKED